MIRPENVAAMIRDVGTHTIANLNQRLTDNNNYQKQVTLAPIINGENGKTFYCAALLPTEQRMIVGAGTSLELWDLSTKRCLTSKSIRQGEIYTTIALSDNIVASGGHQLTNRIHLWRINNNGPVPEIEELPFLIQMPAYGAVRICQGKLVVNCLGHNSIFIWDVSDILAAIGANTQPRSFNNANGSYSAALREPRIVTLPDNQVCYNVLLSQDGRKLIASSGARGSDVDGKIYIINIHNNTTEQTINAHDGIGYGLTLLANGNIASSFNHSESIRIWDINTGLRLRELILPPSDNAEDKQARALVTMPDGTLICLHNKKIITLWDSDTGRCIKTLTGPDTLSWSIKILANNDLVIVGGDPYHAPHPRLNYIWQFTKLTYLEHLCELSRNIPELRSALLNKIKAEDINYIKLFLKGIPVEQAQCLLATRTLTQATDTSRAMPELRSLALFDRPLNSAEVCAIAWLANKNPFLQELVLHGIQLNDAAVAEIGQAIAHHKRLHRLVLTGNPRITAQSIQQLQQLLSNNYRLCRIELPNHLSAQQLLPLMEIARRNSNLAEQLISAAKAGNTQIVQNLLQQGVSIDYVDIRQSTALIEAVRNGHSEVVRLLLNAGADPGHLNHQQESARLIARIRSEDQNSADQESYRSLLELIDGTNYIEQQLTSQQPARSIISNAQLMAQQGFLRNTTNQNSPQVVARRDLPIDRPNI